MHEKIKRFIETYEESYDKLEGVLVFKNLKVYDTDFASISYKDNTFYFEFDEEDLEDFTVSIEDIQDIIFDSINDITSVFIYLNNGDVVSVHCM
jgi:CRISPR/Cas system-associated endonuclease Cas1